MAAAATAVMEGEGSEEVELVAQRVLMDDTMVACGLMDRHSRLDD